MGCLSLAVPRRVIPPLEQPRQAAFPHMEQADLAQLAGGVTSLCSLRFSAFSSSSTRSAFSAAVLYRATWPSSRIT